MVCFATSAQRDVPRCTSFDFTTFECAPCVQVGISLAFVNCVRIVCLIFSRGRTAIATYVSGQAEHLEQMFHRISALVADSAQGEATAVLAATCERYRAHNVNDVSVDESALLIQRAAKQQAALMESKDPSLSTSSSLLSPTKMEDAGQTQAASHSADAGNPTMKEKMEEKRAVLAPIPDLRSPVIVS